MLGRLLRANINCMTSAITQTRFFVPYKTIARMDKLSNEDLFNPTYVKHMCATRFPGHTMKSMRNLYHGVKMKSGHKVCFSEKKHKRWFKPNTFRREYTSQILDKTFGIHVSTKAIKTIRKYGGFDNYILLAKPEKTQSLFGEYLRRLMYMKLNNPQLDIANSNIYGMLKGPITQKPRTKMTRFLGFSKDTRHKDLSAVNPDFFTEMTKKEIATVNEIYQNPDRAHDILSKDQSYLDSVAKAEEEMKKLLPLSKKIKAEFENMKDKKYLRLYKLQVYDAKKNAGNMISQMNANDMSALNEVEVEDSDKLKED